MNTKHIVRWLIAVLLLANSVGAAMLWQAWQERQSASGEPLSPGRSQDSSDKGPLRGGQLGISPFEATGKRSQRTHSTNHP
jgi:hypothetical protein